MDRRKLLVSGAMMLGATSCGYILYPGRRGRTGGRIDIPVLIIDILWFIPGIVPGLVCLIVDFASGCIYEGGSGGSAKTSSPPSSTESREATVEIELDGDIVAMGKVAGDYIVKQTGGKGVVIQLEGTQGASATTDRKTGFEQVAKANPAMKVFSYVGDYRMNEAVKAMEDALVAHPDVVAVYAHNDTMAIAAGKVLAERGKKNIPIVGMDGAKEGCDGIRSGQMTASVQYPTMFPEALDLAMKVLRGESVPKRTMLQTPLITKDNLAQLCGSGA